MVVDNIINCEQFENNKVNNFMPSELILFLFIVLGLASGLLAGLLGIGGGVITVPVLYFIFHYSGIFEVRVMQIAVSTSLAAAIVTSAVSTYVQFRNKTINFSAVKLLVPGLVIGCIAGAISAHYLSSAYLRLTFGVMAILLGIYFFFPRLPHLSISSSPNQSLSIFALAIGWLSSMLGIGGGSLTFPVLIGYHIPVKNASATSSFSTLISVLIATITYLIIAWHKPELPNTFGYVEIPAFICISLGSIFTSPIGVRLSHTLNVVLIKRVFGCSLSVVGLSMLFL